MKGQGILVESYFKWNYMKRNNLILVWKISLEFFIFRIVYDWL